MKLLILSDLHLEFADFTPPTADVDVVVLAGDISKKDHGIHWARATWPHQEIIYVAGNHEFYHTERNNCLSKLRSTASENGVHFLENDEVIIQGVRFLGCTLWTDFELFKGKYPKTKVMKACKEGLADFRWVKEFLWPFTPNEAKRLFNQSKNWLKQKLVDEPFDGNTVVITHHLPSFLSIAPEYTESLSSAGFASHLDELLGYSKLWIHGHTHTSFDYISKVTRVVCNPRGYMIRGEIENTKFDPSFVVVI